ncbi:hypothetical protein A3770_13p69470 [Chloropicon primus]|uniref:Uncharacterized protein n=1 Tax=Chloropicon primus TaxID=1764295 RepID=A0A5B8MV45_9CHLO|nr:hypothetical protein A3770_13p69470 [Chloropicon primus]|eukprot:QDZ24429.1 hypothetical protein A3770_13p69470 [Chloropicon primus]
MSALVNGNDDDRRWEWRTFKDCEPGPDEHRAGLVPLEGGREEERRLQSPPQGPRDLLLSGRTASSACGRRRGLSREEKYIKYLILDYNFALFCFVYARSFAPRELDDDRAASAMRRTKTTTSIVDGDGSWPRRERETRPRREPPVLSC